MRKFIKIVPKKSSEVEYYAISVMSINVEQQSFPDQSRTGTDTFIVVCAVNAHCHSHTYVMSDMIFSPNLEFKIDLKFNQYPFFKHH